MGTAQGREGSDGDMARNDFSESDELTMRALRPDDFEQFEQLVRTTKSIVEPPESWIPYEGDELRRLLEPDIAHNIGLYDGSDLIGTAFLVKPGNTLLSESHELALCGVPSKGTAEITHIMLDSDWRGYGYANSMVDDLLKVAEGIRGIHRVYALVHPYDKQSRKLFERSLFITCCGAKVPDGRELHLYQYWFEDKTDHSRR